MCWLICNIGDSWSLVLKISSSLGLQDALLSQFSAHSKGNSEYLQGSQPYTQCFIPGIWLNLRGNSWSNCCLLIPDEEPKLDGIQGKWLKEVTSQMILLVDGDGTSTGDLLLHQAHIHPLAAISQCGSYPQVPVWLLWQSALHFIHRHGCMEHDSRWGTTDAHGSNELEYSRDVGLASSAQHVSNQAHSLSHEPAIHPMLLTKLPILN